MYKLQKKNRILIAPLLYWLIALFIATLISTTTAIAANDSPAGKWRNIDDKTGKAKSIIEITLLENTLQGKIIALLNPSQPNPLCKKCKGEKANKPIIDMVIIWGVIQDGDHWGKGNILDPKNGKVYKVKLHLSDQGQKLNVRGYIGTPLLGRTQIWERVSNG